MQEKKFLAGRKKEVEEYLKEEERKSKAKKKREVKEL